ncbi:hypothetical protein [Nocardiopsis alba]|uniref:hypothetical protein n=1 Tax=Nocardiopsis alba TaxID=53437 RepID=UPI0035D533F8
MTLTAAIMTHARRREHAERLAVLCSDLAPTVVEDPGVGSTLVTSAMAWATAEGASHHIVLQDDVLPVEGLTAHVVGLVARAPDAALSLFTEWGCRTAARVRIAALAGEATAPVVDPYVPSLALVLPTPVALAFAEHARGLDPATPDDVALRAFLNSQGVRQLVSVPDLVEHDTDGSTLSLTGNAFQGVRRSVCFGPLPRETANPSSESAPRLAHIGWMRAAAEVFDDGPEAPPTFVGTPLAQALPEQVEPALPAERFEETLTRVEREHGPELTRVLHRTVLFELWTAWYANGLGSGLDERHLERDRLDPVAEAALGTVLPGVFRRFVPVETLETVREHAVTFVLDALRYGVAEPDRIRGEWLAG